MTTTVSPQPELTSTSTGKASMPLTAADKTRACMGGYWFNEGVRAMRFFGGYGEPVGKLNKIGKAPGQNALNCADAGTLAEHGNHRDFLFDLQFVCHINFYLAINVYVNYIPARYLYASIMKKRAGRPKVGIKDAKSLVFSARFTPAEAKLINQRIQHSCKTRSEWVRNKLLSAF
jgi:hypothetical protein